MALTHHTWHEQPARPRTDAWSRAAQRVLLLATARGRTLDPETLLLSDVRDLQALAWLFQMDEAALAVPSWLRQLDRVSSWCAAALLGSGKRPWSARRGTLAQSIATSGNVWPDLLPVWLQRRKADGQQPASGIDRAVQGRIPGDRGCLAGDHRDGA